LRADAAEEGMHYKDLIHLMKAYINIDDFDVQIVRDLESELNTNEQQIIVFLID